MSHRHTGIGILARGLARTARLALLALAFAAAEPVAAQTASPAPGAASASLPDAELLRVLRAGGVVVYFRHTATDFSRDDRQMRDHDDCDNQRPLTPLGRTQARTIGRHWKRLKIPVGTVLASPYCRTREVAQLMFGRYERSDAVRGGPVEEGGERYAGLRRLLSSTPAPAASNLVISSHGNPYQAVVGPPYLAEGEAAVIRPLGEGRWEVLARLQADHWARLR